MSQLGLVDLQVNGFAGVDFNSDELTVDEVHEACLALAQLGTSAILGTVITDQLESMQRRIARLVQAIDESPEVARLMRGLHVEGPFISGVPGYVGAHPPAGVQPASVEAARRLLDAGQGHVRLVTLAPEQDARGATTQFLVDNNVLVSAGHCNPTRDELEQAIDCGLSLFTHLGNGCPLELPRHDNIIQRVLSMSDRLWVCFIADGIHVPYFALGNYLRATGIDRAIVVSDAIAAAGKGQGEFTLAGQKVVVDEHFATWTADRSHLVGSALSMRQAYENLRTQLKLDDAAALRLTRTNPRRVLADAGLEVD